MSYEITCPYCFGKFSHTKIHFRSEKVNAGECEYIPDEYDDISDFMARYHGQDRAQILEKYNDWAFFQETEDAKYEHFWNDRDEGYGGTTEINPADEKLGVAAYRRRVIDPGSPEHARYLKKQADGGYLIYDVDGLATNIELATGESCNRRVCPYCHNPLPPQYGKHPVKFTTVIGITGAGKTVYLSQLISKLKNYADKVGLSAVNSTPSARQFLENNRVSAGQPLPGSTPPTRLLQPLFYDLVKNSANGTRETQTFVLYDVAGENCVDPTLMHRFGRFIENADGIFLLIDPMQFEAVNDMTSQDTEMSAPTEVLDSIHNLVAHGSANKKCDIPIAICISKSDIDEVQDVLDQDLCALLMDDVRSLRNRNGHGVTRFNASEYNPIAEGLKQFVLDNESTLESMMYINYSIYNYFAFSALGCEVEDGKPVGPLLPKRIEEPLLWLFHQFGYIDSDVKVYRPNEEIIPCPECSSEDTEELPEPEEIVVGKLFKKKKIVVSHRCNACQHMW